MKVTRMGDGLAVHIPADVADALGLREGDEVDLARIEKKPECAATFEDFSARLEEFSGALPADFKFDREEANAR